MHNDVMDRRTQLIAKPATPVAKPQWGQDGRAQQRTRVYGRASLPLPSNGSVSGNVYDMTHGGISILLDRRLPMGQTYTLQLSIYRNGKLHRLSLPALCIHESLMGGQGFKHGFQFAAHSDTVRQALGEVLS